MSPLGQPPEREARVHVRVHGALAGHLAQQVEVAVEPRPRLAADGQQVAQLAVVDAHVDVDGVLRRWLVRHGLLEVVEHHVRVVHVGLDVLGEAVAVVPLAHQAQGLVHVLVERAAVPVQLQQTPRLGLREAEHLVEVRVQADVPADVEAAGHVVQGDGRDAGDEQPLDAAAALPGARLERREEAAEEAAAVRERLVGLRAPMRQDRVREVVVLVDHHVQRDVVRPDMQEQLPKLAVDARRREDSADRRLREEIGVPLDGVPDEGAAIVLEALPQRLQRVVEGGEVEAQDDVAPTVLGGLAADVGAVEHRVPEVRRHDAAVVVLQHGYPQALAEAAGPDEEGVALVLQPAQEAGLVDVQPAPQQDAADVGLAVGDARAGRGHGR